MKNLGMILLLGMLNACVPVPLPPSSTDETAAKDVGEDVAQSKAYKYAKKEYQVVKKDFEEDDQ